MDRHTRHIALFLLAVFASFVCGNTCFVHSHRLFDGHIEVHSHPWMPGTSHTHSDAGFQGIVQLNTALASMMSAPVADVPAALVRRVRPLFSSDTFRHFVFNDIRNDRAPPAFNEQ